MAPETLQTFRDSAIGPSDRAGVRREVFEGREHLVVPVVMIVEGVLNNALVASEEFGRYPESWNGRPVPVLHPEREGTPVSANQPDVIERNTIGQLFNTFVDNGKLKSEAWIDTDKARRLGHGALLEALEAGEVIEVSTGYFSDSEGRAGTFNGQEYREIHRNIRPDHLALLPGEEGACSVADGCGTRVNHKGFGMKTKEAFNTLARALGLSTNCQCEEESTMTDDMIQRAETLKANGSLSAKQFQMIQDMDEEGRTMLRALIDAMAGIGGNESDTPDEEPAEMKGDDYESNVTAQSAAIDPAKVDEMVANKVADHLRRHEVTAKLKTNERNPFSEDEMRTMSVDHLEKLEQSIRPADYSGQGGFAANSDAVDTDVQPLTIHRGVLGRREQ